MNGDRREFQAKSCALYRCGHCFQLHLRCQIGDSAPEVVVTLDADQWAEMLMADPIFRFEAAAILQRSKMGMPT